MEDNKGEQNGDKNGDPKKTDLGGESTETPKTTKKETKAADDFWKKRLKQKIDSRRSSPESHGLVLTTVLYSETQWENLQQINKGFNELLEEEYQKIRASRSMLGKAMNGLMTPVKYCRNWITGEGKPRFDLEEEEEQQLIKEMETKPITPAMEQAIKAYTEESAAVLARFQGELTSVEEQYRKTDFFQEFIEGEKKSLQQAADKLSQAAKLKDSSLLVFLIKDLPDSPNLISKYAPLDEAFANEVNYLKEEFVKQENA